MRNAIKISKSKRQMYEYDLLIKNLNKYKKELKRLQDKFHDDDRNIFYLNMSSHYLNKIHRIERLLTN